MKCTHFRSQVSVPGGPPHPGPNLGVGMPRKVPGELVAHRRGGASLKDRHEATGLARVHKLLDGLSPPTAFARIARQQRWDKPGAFELLDDLVAAVGVPRARQ